MKQVIEPSLESFSGALLDSLSVSGNPHVELYARWLIYQRAADTLVKRTLVNDMFVSGNQHVKKLGIYFAHRDGLLTSIDASLLEPHLQSLFPETILNDIENFRLEFSEVFGISLAQDFPMGKYFGNITEIAPIMRFIYATKDQGATQFVKSLHSFLEIFLVNMASVERGSSIEADIKTALEILDDNRLYLLDSTLRGELSKDFAKEGIQSDLVGRFTSGVKTRLNDWLLAEAKETHVRNQVFICYAREDEDCVELLLEHWRPIEDYHESVDIWSDKKIETGDHWREEIMNALAKAKIAVLFVSRTFLASRFIKKVELPAILQGEQK